MEITEVRIKLMDDSSERLQAFCSITFDNCFVIRDLKIIEGSNGPFVAMPSRKLTSHCPQCRCKNHLRAAHCNQCGLRLKDDRAIKDAEGRSKLYADIAHPINSECREQIQERVVAEFRREKKLAAEPGYVSRYDDYDIEDTIASAYETTKFEKADKEPRAPHSPASRARPANRSTSEKGAKYGSSGGPHTSPTPQSNVETTSNSLSETTQESLEDQDAGKRSGNKQADQSGDTGGAKDKGFGAGIF